jgi:hypothetical protein
VTTHVPALSGRSEAVTGVLRGLPDGTGAVDTGAVVAKALIPDDTETADMP